MLCKTSPARQDLKLDILGRTEAANKSETPAESPHFVAAWHLFVVKHCNHLQLQNASCFQTVVKQRCRGEREVLFPKVSCLMGKKDTTAEIGDLVANLSDWKHTEVSSAVALQQSPGKGTDSLLSRT